MAGDTRQSYEECWKHPRWQQLRLKVFERDGWECVGCGDKEETLVAHHLRYCGLPYESPIEDLQTLCQSCHDGLGQHPKGGVWYYNDENRSVMVHVEWCPNCGGVTFKDKGTWVKCLGCGWDSGHLFECGAGVSIGDGISFPQLAQLPSKGPAAKKPFNPSTLKAYMTKARNAGVSDAEVVDAVFSGPLRDMANGVFDAIAILRESRKSGTVEDEIAAAVSLVKARRAIAEAVVPFGGFAT